MFFVGVLPRRGGMAPRQAGKSPGAVDNSVVAASGWDEVVLAVSLDCELVHGVLRSEPP